MMVPVQLGVIPLYIEMIHLGWVNDLKAVIAPNLVTAFGVFLMRQYIVQAVPNELVDAARVDGCHTLADLLARDPARRCGRSRQCSACSRSR